MGKIHILPDTLISQIAAGEVVERPASVVKELLENSVDAGADQCSVEVEQGGMKLIAVRDNGSGMSKEDANMAFARHATSKISNLEDLSCIRSFGFRGEALSAIASVAIVTMRTRTLESNSGWEIHYKGGKLDAENSAASPQGTEISVRNLFFNTPARKKFLKSETTELGHIISVVSHFALSHPHVGFELKHNGKTLIQVPKSSGKKERLAAIAGKDFLDFALEVEFQTPSIHIHGFVGASGASLSSKRHQYLFVNGRDVSDPMVSRAVFDAYGSRLPARSYPLFLLHIDVDPKEVDVNVHPRKLAVKFLDAQRIFRDISQAVSQALAQFQENIFSVPRAMSYEQTGRARAMPPTSATATQKSLQEAISFSQEFMKSAKRPEGLHSTTDDLPPILGQIANSYIVIHDEEGLAIVDQHAAHERILYEKFSGRAADAPQQSQPLLVPLQLDCSPQEALFLKEAISHLQSMGFEFDEWSGGTFVMRSCPAYLHKENIGKIFRDFLADMNEGEKTSRPSKPGATPNILPEKNLKSLACKAAIKFGMPLSNSEQENLIRDLRKTANNSTCPHGRPTKLLLTFDELEKRFYRRK